MKAKTKTFRGSNILMMQNEINEFIRQIGWPRYITTTLRFAHRKQKGKEKGKEKDKSYIVSIKYSNDYRSIRDGSSR